MNAMKVLLPALLAMVLGIPGLAAASDFDYGTHKVIPSGVAHISWLQHQGYTYSKP